MITYEDCLALSELTAEEVDLIAAHEHVPPIVALALGSYLARTAAGKRRIRWILGDQSRTADARRGGPRDAIAVAILTRVPKPEAKPLAA